MANKPKLTLEEQHALAEKGVRLGQNIRLIGEMCGVSHTTIKRWKIRYGWTADRSQEVRDKTRAALAVEGGSTEKGSKRGSKVSKVEMDQRVEEAIATNIAVVREHRKDIKRLRTLTNKLALDLEDVADCRERIIKLIEADDLHPQTRSAMLRAVSLPGNAGVLRDLTTSYQRLAAMERTAFGLDDNGPQAPPPFEDTLSPEKRRALEAAAVALGKEVCKECYD